MSDFWKSVGSTAATGLGTALGGLPGALLGAGVSGLISNFFQKKQNDTNVKSSKELMDYQTSLNQSTWEQQFQMQNQRQDEQLLNQASLQKQSLQNAGLSAALMNGSVPQTAGVSNPSGGSANSSVNGNMDMSALMGISNALSQMEVNKATVGNINADTNLKNVQAQGYANENSVFMQKTNAYLRNLDASSNLLDEQAKSVIEDTKKTVQDVTNSIQLTKSQLGLNDKQVELMSNQIINLIAETDVKTAEAARQLIENQYLPKMFSEQISLLKSQQKLNKAQAKKAMADMTVAFQQVKLMQSQQRLNDQQATYFASLASSIDADTTWKQFENRVKIGLGESWWKQDENRRSAQIFFNNMKSCVDAMSLSNGYGQFITDQYWDLNKGINKHPTEIKFRDSSGSW